MPVRSPRYVYKISSITASVDDSPTAIDLAKGTGATEKALYVKMKKSIGDWLGLTPLAYNAPEWTGTFAPEQTGATNDGSKFRRRIGGFRVASYTLIAEKDFEITELVKNKDTGDYSEVKTKFQTISIGFPRGHSVTEVINWLGTTTRMGEIAAIRTPAGASYPISTDVTP